MLKSLSVLVFSLILFGIVNLYLGKDLNYDLVSYHFYNGFAYLNNRYDLDMAPAVFQTYINPYFDVINYYLLSTFTPKVATFFLACFSAVSIFILYLIAKLLFAQYSRPSLLVWFTLFISFTGSLNITLSNITSNDNKENLLVISALYLCLYGIQNLTANKKILLLAGFIIGMASGFKLPAFCFAFGMFSALFWTIPKNKGCLRMCSGFLIAMSVGFILIDGHWLLKNYFRFHNPIFPFYNQIFHSPWAPDTSFNFPPTKEKRDLWHYVFLPVFLATKNSLYSEVSLRDCRFLLIFLLYGSYLWNYSKRASMTPAWIFLHTFFLASYTIWLMLFSVYRYALPLELISSLLIIHLCCLIFTKNPFYVISGITLILLLSTVYPQWSYKVKFDDHYFYLKPPALPSNTRVLLITTAIGYTIPFFSTDNRFFGMPFITLGGNDHSLALLEMIRDISFPQQSVYTLALKSSKIMPGLIARSQSMEQRHLMILKHFGFTQDKHKCVRLETNTDDVLELCPLEH